MSPAALVAFGVVFVLTSFALSAVFCAALLLARSWLRHLGPWAERRAVTAALLLPSALALGLVGVLAMDSALELTAGTDHCLRHSHHLHLCLKHSGAWAARPWAICLVIAVTTFVAVRLMLSLWAHRLAQHAVDRLREQGTLLGRGCYVVPADEPFAFTAGLRSPTVVISGGAWSLLDAEQRDAVLAHELAHVEHGDVWRRTALGIISSLGAPILVGRLLRLWELSAERLCDHEAARAVGRPSTVAGAMLMMLRSAPPRIAPDGAVFAAASHVPERVESLLSEEPDGERPSRILMIAASAALVLFGMAFAAFSEPLHHVLETILG